MNLVGDEIPVIGHIAGRRQDRAQTFKGFLRRRHFVHPATGCPLHGAPRRLRMTALAITRIVAATSFNFVKIAPVQPLRPLSPGGGEPVGPADNNRLTKFKNLLRLILYKNIVTKWLTFNYLLIIYSGQEQGYANRWKPRQ